MIFDKNITANQIMIEHLSSTHKEYLKNFKSYETELMDFLVEDALENQNKKISKTYLWFLKSSKEIIGYVTLLTDKISLTTALKEEFKEKGINYKSLPALKVGRLCVEDKFLKKGVGKLIIQFVLYQVQKINERCGCRFITLDAKRNSDKLMDSIHFYKKMGFVVLKEREKGTTPMYKDIFKILEQSN